MLQKNAIYAQSGGVTAVINATAAGVITAFRNKSLSLNLADGSHNPMAMGKLYAAENGIHGVLHENLIDTSVYSEDIIKQLPKTPGGAFGSCRYKLKSLEQNRKEYERLITIFAAYNIGYFFYNGGNDSADTCLKVSQVAHELGYPICAIHIPKTIDNDLVVTDNCPGFGSVAKYIATSVMEAGYDIASMYPTSTKVFIMEVMGRNAGWIAASSGVATTSDGMPPHMILFPEITFDEISFLAKVKQTVERYGYCVIAASEGIKCSDGRLLSQNDSATATDAFGHAQLGGVAGILSNLVTSKLKLKCHYAIADYLQRSARHIASKVDLEQAYQLGCSGVDLAFQGYNSIMPYIKRISSTPYKWEIKHTSLENIANYEKYMPRDFITEDGFHITDKCREYIMPLMQGEDYPEYINGLPQYIKLENKKEPKILPLFNK